MTSKLFKEYQHSKSEISKKLKSYVKQLTFDEAASFYEMLLSISTEDAFIVGLEILEKEEGVFVTTFSDSFGCMLWADGSYSMLPYLIEKMDSNEERKEIFLDYIHTLVLGCSQTRKPLNEKEELEPEVKRLIELYRNRKVI